MIKLANRHAEVAKAALKKQDAVLRFVYGPNKCLVVHIVRFQRVMAEMKSQLRSLKTIPSITIELYVKSPDGSNSFAVMPGCELDGFQDFADEHKMVHSFLKATDVGTMCYALDEEEPAKILRVYEGPTPGIAIKTEVVGTATVVRGSDIVAIQEGRSAGKKKSKEKVASLPAPDAATAAGKASTPAKAATDASADTTAPTTTASKMKKKDKAATKKKSADAPANVDKDKVDTPEKPAAPATAKPKAAGKKGKDPNAPKRAMNAYMHYSSTNRAKIKEADKEASVSDVAKKLGEAWRGLSDNERKRYEDMAAKDKERYQKEMEAYNSKKDCTDKSADEPAKESAKEPAEKKSKAKAKTATKKKAPEKKDGKDTDASKASASSKKKDAPAADTATITAAEKPQAKPKPISQAAKRAEEKKEIDMLQAKFLELPKKIQDKAISKLPVTADRVHILGPVGKDIMRKTLSEAGIVLDDGGDDDNDSPAAVAPPAKATKKKKKKASKADDAKDDGDDDAGNEAGASAKKKAPSTPRSKTKASADITSPNAQKFEEWESLTEAPKGFKFPPKLKSEFTKGDFSKEEKWSMFLAYLKRQRKTERAKKRKAEAEAAATKEKAAEDDKNVSDGSDDDDDSQEKSSSKKPAAKKRKKSSSTKSHAKKDSSKKAATAAAAAATDDADMSSDDDFEKPKSKKKKAASAKKDNAGGKKRKKSSADENDEETSKPKAAKTPKKDKNGHKKGSLDEVKDPEFKCPKAIEKKFDAADTYEEKQELLAKHREKIRKAVQKSKEKKEKQKEEEAAAAAAKED